MNGSCWNTRLRDMSCITRVVRSRSSTSPTRSVSNASLSSTVSSSFCRASFSPYSLSSRSGCHRSRRPKFSSVGHIWHLVSAHVKSFKMLEIVFCCSDAATSVDINVLGITRWRQWQNGKFRLKKTRWRTTAIFWVFWRFIRLILPLTAR